MAYLDLTHHISEATPVYPGDPKVEIKPAGIIDQAGFTDHQITFGTHIGTHMDAPAHMLINGKNLEDYPIDKFTGTAVCVYATNPESILLPDLSEVDAVFFYTGASDRYKEASYWEDYTVIPTSILDQLVDAKVNVVGVDTGSVDSLEGFPIHKKLLENDILIIENLTNLKDLANKAFEFTALPLNVALDGAPVRVIAKV